MRLLMRLLPTYLFLFAILAVFAGCLATKPAAPARLPVDVPDSFLAKNETSGGMPSAPRPQPARWWTEFNQPALTRLVDWALSDNLSLRQMLARVAESEALARKAGAPLWPSLSVEGSASHITTHAPRYGSALAGTAFGDRITTEERQYRGSLLTAYEIDLWGRVKNSRAALALEAQARTSDYEAAGISLAGQVADTWLQILEQRETLALLQEQVASVQTFLDLQELRFSRGQSVATDVYAQRQQLAGVKAQVPPVQTRLRILEHQLAVLLGCAPGAASLPVDDVLPELPALPGTGLPAELLMRRPDLQAARDRLLAADRSVATAVADRMPAFRLTANLSDTTQRSRELFENWMLTLAANLSAPILDGGARAAEVNVQHARLDQTLQQYGHAYLTALQEVEDALAQELGQNELLKRLEEQHAAAAQTLAASRRRYSAGVGDYLRVLTALQAKLSLERQQVAARRQRLSYRVALYKALAGPWSHSPPMADVLVAETVAEDMDSQEDIQ